MTLAPKPAIEQSTDSLYSLNLNSKEAANRLKVSVQTLANWRHLQKGPAYIKMSGGKVIYRCSDLDAYLEAQRIDPESR